MSDAVVTLNDTNFDEQIISTELPALVDLWAPWCAPCRMIAPTVEEIAGDYADKAIVGKLNVDENPMIARKYGVTSIPTLLFFKGGEVVDQMIGVPAGNAKKIIEEKLQDAM
jgi:thioredoxin 1